MVTWSWGAYFVYVGALCLETLGGFMGLIASGGHPAFLAPVLMGLFFFYITWEIVVDEDDLVPPRPPSKQT